MKRLRALALALSSCVFGCSGGCSGPSEDRPRAEGEERASGGERSSDERAGGGEPGAAPTVRVAGAVDPHSRNVVVRIENRGDAPTQVKGELILQRRAGESWEDVRAQVDLRFDCGTVAPDCAELAPGAVLIPPAWLGTLGDAQCVCTRCGPAPAGTYRFVAQSCDGAHRVEGEPFDLPPQ